MNRGLSPWVSELGILSSTKKFLRTVSDEVVWPTRVSDPVTPRAMIRYSESAEGALNVTRALPPFPVTTPAVQWGVWANRSGDAYSAKRLAARAPRIPRGI